MQQTKTVDSFQLNPLTVCIRLALASGVFFGALAPVHAELPIPAPILVTSGIASQHTAGNTMTVKQETPTATLNWNKFNVGTESRVVFEQPSNAAIALNRISDSDPSKILGTVSANGQLYLYNQNGFVFGKDASVNANTAIVSTLDITDEALKSGITQQAGMDTDKPSLGAEGSRVNSHAAINVEKGAKLHVNKDGLLVLAAPSINNKGSLSADDYGQVVLVASKDKVYLQATDKNSPFHGLLVEVDTGGKVTNAGDIVARQGTITLQGFAVNQQGRITATTSVNENGSIRLLAQEQHDIQSGKIIASKTVRDSDAQDGLGTESKVTFSKGSMTQVIADDKNGGTAIDAQAQRPSVIDTVADKVHIQSGATVKATSGKLNVIATDDLSIIQPDGSIIMSPQAADGKHHGRILIEKNAVLDVSGTKGVKVDMTRNVADISVQSYELRDAPEQKTGVLKGATLSVDIRKNTPIVDTTGVKARVQRRIAERLAEGGTIDLVANGDTLVNSGAVIDISGGSVDYQSGTISTTQLVTDYGGLVDISRADPKEHYAKLAENKTVFEQGYSEGQRAGAINLQTPLLAWHGELKAGAIAGIHQRELNQLPFGGALLFNQQDSGDLYLSTQNVRFSHSSNPLALGIDDPTFSSDLVLSPDLINHSGIQDVVVKTSGNAIIAKDSVLQLALGSAPPSKVDASNAALTQAIFAGTNNAEGGYFALEATNIKVDGRLYAPSGTINLSTHFADTAPIDTLGKIDITQGAALSVSGRWINDLANGFAVTASEALAINGGNINISAIGDLTVQSGATINADAGAWLALDNKLIAGEAGAIDLAAVGNGSIPSLLTLNGSLSAYGINSNGQLRLTSGKISVGTSDSVSDTGVTPLVLHQQNAAFAWSGFSKINLTSKYDALVVKDSTQLHLRQENLWLDSQFQQMASDASLAAITYLNTLPDYLRQSISLTLAGITGVEVQTGSTISTDKQAAITLNSDQGRIYVDGTLDAPAGNISLTVKADPSVVNYNATQAIWLGSHAQLRATGTAVMKPLDGLNRHSGDVLGGGAINLLANRGYVLQQRGSRLNVSGTKASLDLPSADGIHYAATEVGSNAGQITIAAAEGIVLNGKMSALAGANNNANGRLDVILDRNLRNLTTDSQGFNLNPATSSIMQGAPPLLSSHLHFGDALPDSMNGLATISADTLKQAGFGDIRFNNPDEIRFIGAVNLNSTQRLDLNSSKISAYGGSVQIQTPYLKLGSELGRNNLAIADAPLAGTSRFSAKTQWLDLIGATRWDGFQAIDLNSQHDIRATGVRIGSQRDFIGALTTAAELHLTASQIYPTTLSNFSFTLDKTVNPTGQISIDGNNSDRTPLSAKGVLSFTAPTIAQNGVLKAPFGTINLTADKRLSFGAHSVTSVSADTQIIPFGVTQGGLNWLYPLDAAAGNLVFNLNPSFLPIQTKQLDFNAPQIVMARGSLIDVSGGGDLQAYEFQTGAGGTNDYLAAISPNDAGSYAGGFAIVPNLGWSIAPLDPAQEKAVENLSNTAHANFFVGSQIYLSGTDKLPAGTYTVLPPRYALLSGAFLVTPQANSTDNRIASYSKDGLPIISGYQSVAGTSIYDSRWHSFLIEQGSDVRQHSQYDENTANDFFSKQASNNNTTLPAIPKDSGHITLSVDKQLVLAGQIHSSADGTGRGAKVDISSSHIEIVKQLPAQHADNTSLAILDSDLTGLNLDSLLLGGTRRVNTATGATAINVTAESVIFDQDVTVSAKDLLATANDSISVNSGATLSVTATVNTGDSLFNVVGDGALLRLSGDKQIKLQRTESTGETGNLFIAKQAVLQGATLADNRRALQSAMLAASHSNTLAGELRMNGGSLNLNAKAIALGEVDRLNTDALKLSNTQLAEIQVDELQLNSQQAISLHGNIGELSNNSFNPLQFNSLIIDAAGLVGTANQGKSAKIQADTLVLQNSTHAPSLTASTGKGTLTLSSTYYSQGEGTFGINGFNSAQLIVSATPAADKTVQGGFINAEGDSQLNVAADLKLTANYLTTTGGSTFAIDASGHKITFNEAGTNNRPSTVAFGGALHLTADAIDLNSKVILPSGTVQLHALEQAINVGANAELDLAGRAVRFADVSNYTAGGSFTAIADWGRIILAKGSAINLSAGDSHVTGGDLTLQAPKQSVTLSGDLTANKGSALIDVAQFASSKGFDNLLSKLSAAGINKTLYIRQREHDIVQGATSTINAQDVTLTADTGSIAISGTINAQDGTKGGTIALYAGDHISLHAGSQLTAEGSSQGGKVLLAAVDNDSTNDITLNTGAGIDVSGGKGKIVLRAARTEDSIAIDPIAADVKGYSAFYADAVKTYSTSDLTSAGEIQTADIAQIKADTDAYMSRASIRSISDNIRLRPSIALNVDSDLTLKSHWDFAAWRYHGTAGSLSVNASGTINLASSVSDAITNDGAMLSGESWSYQWVAGADLSSADKFATVSAKDLIIGKNAPEPVLNEFGVAQTNYEEQLVNEFGSPVFDAFGLAVYNHLYSNAPEPVRNAEGYPVPDLTNPVYDEFASPVYDEFGNQLFYYLYDSTVTVRTGTGDINLAAGANIIFKNQSATVYNTGRPDVTDRYGSLGVDYGSVLGGTANVEYPIAGGDMVLKATHTIQGAVSDQFISAWLPRIGDWGDSTLIDDGNSKTVSAWGVIATEFAQNIGSFGGGNVTVTAGDTIHDLSVMMPTTGKQIGTAYADGSINPNTNMPNFTTNAVQINGGGTLQLNAGHDIAGGAYLLGQGMATLNAGGAITGGTQFSNGPQLVMGDSCFSLQAARGISIGAVSDAMTFSNVNQFYSYSVQSAISVNALSGDIQLGADTAVIRDNLLALNRTGDDIVTSVYPASLQSTAFGGSIALDAITLLPAAVTQLELLAQQAITSHLNGGIYLYDVNTRLLPSSTTPRTSPDFASVFGPAAIAPAIMHTADSEPARIVTQQGDINGVIFNIAKPAIIQAGRDFSNVSIAIQNINTDDVSLLSAGRDIRYNTTINDIGILETPVDMQKIEIAGPGHVLVKTGRTIDLGAANGLLTVGNKNNSNLPITGANLNVLVGLNGNEPNYSGFINYINTLSAVNNTARRNEHFSQYLEQVLKENKTNPNFTVQKEHYLRNLVTRWISRFETNVETIKQLITDFMRQRLANNSLDTTEALNQFYQLSSADYLLIEPQLNLLISQIFFNELKIASNSNVGNENGFKVIDSLFPKNTWQGDLSLILSGLQTLQGGDINLFVPGGNINAGLAFAFPGLEQKKASDLGIIALGDGSVNAFVQNDFKVNQSRVFTQGKGDILIWSGAGDVDAGRGSKSSLAVPETLVSYKNEQKNTLIQPAVSGSGIRAADENGNVYLVAPKGIVNAGEAGIGATNVTISATAVLGGNNIQVGGGTSSGVAAVAAPPPTAAGASNAAASVSQTAQNAAATNEDSDHANKRKKRGKLTVKLLGFG